MEACSVFEDEKKRHRRRLDFLEQQSREVGRNVLSALATSLANHLAQASAESEPVFDEFEARLFQALNVLASTAELIHPSPEILRSARDHPLIEDPTDNLILASILAHAKNQAPGAKVLLTENRKDFGKNGKASDALRDSGVGYFAEPSKFLEWHRARPDQ